MANTINKKILQINTSNSQQSIASLRKEIKDLKDSLVNLQEGTEDYNAAVVECGNKLHQLQEIQEQTRGASADFGDVLGNVTGVFRGAVGAVETVTGALSAMGINMGKSSEEVTKVLTSMIAMTQGMAAVDNGLKSLDKLTNVLMSASKSAKTLTQAQQQQTAVTQAAGAAAKAEAAAMTATTTATNAATVATKGFGKALMKTGIGAIIVLVGVLISKIADLTQSVKSHNEHINTMTSQYEHLKWVMGDLQRQAGVDIELFNIENDDIVAQAEFEAHKMYELYEEAQKNRVEFEASMEGARKKEIEANQDYLDELIKAEEDANQKLNAARDKIIIATAKKNKQANDEQIKAEEEAKKKKKQIWEKELQERENTLKARAQLEEKYRQAMNEAVLIATPEDMQQLTELKTMGDQLVELDGKLAANKEKLSAMTNKQSSEYLKLSNETLELETQIQELTNDMNKLSKSMEDNASKATAEQAEAIERARQAMEEYQLYVNSQDWTNQDWANHWESQLQSLELEYEAGIVLEEEYWKKKLELTQNYEEAQTAVTQEATEKRQTIQQNALEATQAIMGALGSVLGGLADEQEEGTKSWKNLKISEAVINMLSGALAAFTGAMQLGFPLGPIVGGIQSAAVLALGAMQIGKIKNTQISKNSSGSASGASQGVMPPSSNAVNSLTTNWDATNMVNGMNDIQDRIGDQRVYVTTDDIENASQDKKVTVTNNKW